MGEMRSAPLYPMFVRLTGKRCTVVGAGRIAERKIASLLECGGRVTVIAPEATERVQRWHEQGQLEWLRREYEGLPEPAPWMVIAATDRRELNRRVADEASRLGALVDAVDDSGQSDFISPAVVRRGRLTIAVATAGASPAAAKAICRQLESAYGEEYGIYLEGLAKLRGAVREQVAEEPLRRRLLREIAAWDVPGAIRSGVMQAEEWDGLVREIAERPTWETVVRVSERFSGR